MNRRSLIRCAPAAGMAALLAGAVPVIAQAQGETPIMAMFQQWKQAHDYSNERGLDEETADAALAEAIEIENQMIAMPCQSMQDLAAKICAYTSFGAFALSDSVMPELWAEMAAMVEVAA
ncbi:hypothetical protein [Falsirhodobacter sp. 20TX0035]|uniref:hypothetical protein n=1 Tax=Falsirhodobacter sp. 20TX0035 TaxID=3022019 RepID=UPI00232F5440|nr:hypothetical protein [Falsirhodobacter sp. 20TX0035]MDB6454685.1 hypothetical protein [Falsirhodobacter sp. 20TX0035]